MTPHVTLGNSGRSFRLRVEDPRTGEKFWITAYLRNGQLVFQRLGPHLFEDGMTPARGNWVATFGEVAWEAYDEKMVGLMPPAAVRIASLKGRGANAPRKRQKSLSRQRRAARRTRYRELVGEKIAREIEFALRNSGVPRA